MDTSGILFICAAISFLFAAVRSQVGFNSNIDWMAAGFFFLTCALY